MPRGKTKKKYSKSKKSLDNNLNEEKDDVELDGDDYIVQITEAIMYPFNMLSSMFNDNEESDDDNDDDTDESIEEKYEPKKKRGKTKTKRNYK